MMKRVAVCIVGVVVMVVLAERAHAQSIQGTWQFVSATGGNTPDAAEPHGLVIITETHYAWVFYQGDHARGALPPPKTPGSRTDAEALAFGRHMEGIAASTGTYSLTGMSFAATPVIRPVKTPNGYGSPTFTLHFDGNNKVSFTATNGGRVYTLSRVQ